MIIWLSTAPTRHLLREFSFHVLHIGAALRLMADASLTTLDVRMEDTRKLLGTFALHPSTRNPSDTMSH